MTTLISYLKLRELLREKGIQHKELKIISKVSNDTIAKIYKDEYMSMESIEKIARALEVDIGDIVSLK